MADSLFVGIDLGTTNSAAAVFDGERVTVVRNAQGGTVTPSVVRIDKQGRVTVGTRARRFVESDPANTATEFKRLMGTGKGLDLGGAPRKPEELSAEILKALRQDITDATGVVIERAVISVPALFELPQSAATSEAARLAGLARVELLQEPIASALAAGWRAEDDGASSWLVFDLGGGTFDASLLETRDGLLRVIGHDGDNFLGGRDFDWVITEHLASRLARPLLRKDPAHAAALRTLRLAAEDAKIELSRAERAQVTLAQPLMVEGQELEVDLELSREEVERLTLPLCDRAVEVCLGLLRQHGLGPGRLSRVVLVGGPTLMPMVRQRVAARLEAALAEGHDPMTLVAQGAALYAATANLDGRAVSTAPAPPSSRQVWLQYPAVSADLTPHVVGRFLGADPPVSVQLVRADGLWSSPAAPIAADGGFVTMVSLLPRKTSTFRIVARDKGGAELAVTPAQLTLVQGLTIGDPPLSRTVGVALASGYVQVYLERGTPLPARRTFTHKTVETVARGSAESLLRIPIVQGEMSEAHLCRLIGTLDIGGTAVRDTLPSGSSVEVTIELDRGGRMSARALVPALDQAFEHVVHLLVPEAEPDTLDAAIGDLRRQLQSARTDAFRHGLAQVLDKLDRLEERLAEAERDIDAAHGGDADAGQRARRALLDVDAAMAEADLARKWPALEEKTRHTQVAASSLVGLHGTDSERRLLAEVMAAVDRARQDRDVPELERQLALLQRLAAGAYQRTDEAWENYFTDAASEVGSASDLPRAQRLVTEGHAALARRDTQELRRVVKALWQLLPEDSESRKRGFDSGVR